MQKVIIENSKVSYIELTPEEEAIHLAETTQRKREEEGREVANLKAQLLKELLELREMKANPEVFTAEEIAIKQATVEKATEKLKPSNIGKSGP